MSVSTNISEGGKARPFGPVKALMVQGEDGKYYSWCPESEKALGTLSVDKNGIYRASDKGVYGWSSVYVNVATTDSVTGKDPDTGEEVVVRPDPETGELVETVVPVEIRVIEPPTNPFGVYVDGQTITKDGMVVKAYGANGDEMQVVPNAEITLNPTQAVYDQTKDRDIISGDGVNALGLTGSIQYRKISPSPFIPAASRLVFDGVFGASTAPETPEDNPEYEFPILDANKGNNLDKVYLTQYNGKLFAAYNPPQQESKGIIVMLSESYTKGYGGKYLDNIFKVINDARSDDDEYIYGFAPVSDIDPTGADINDMSHQPGSQITITVLWPRPGDGAILETTFDILVGPHGGTGDD